MPITRPAAGEWQAIPRRAHGIVHTSFVEIDADDGVEAAALELSGDILGVVCGVRHTRWILVGPLPITSGAKAHPVERRENPTR
jgi:hypothetical protein